jgi:hypothetical protein
MNSLLSFSTGKGNGKRLSHTPPIDAAGKFPTQGAELRFRTTPSNPFLRPTAPLPFVSTCRSCSPLKM